MVDRFCGQEIYSSDRIIRNYTYKNNLHKELYMKQRFFISMIMAVMGCMASQAKTIYPDSDTAYNEVKLGVEGISRLCPTGLWDHWILRDIEFDKESNTMLLVIHLYNWEERCNTKEITEADAKKQTEWIVENIMKGYNELVKNPHIMCDGDFMLYLSLGTLLRQMEKDGVALRIALVKPDYANLFVKDIPLSLTPAELKTLIRPEELNDNSHLP